MRTDYYATPRELVAIMLGAVEGEDFETILDPAAGDGRLVSAGSVRWPGARSVAIEMDSERASTLARAYAGWDVLNADFLREDLGTASWLNGPLLALLNPPFSGRGGRALSAEWDGQRVTECGRAMAFVMKAASLVARAGGELVAVVPGGLLDNRRDAAARNHLRAHGQLVVVGRTDGYAFVGAATTTAIIRWAPGMDLPPVRGEVAVRRELSELRVVRGALPVYKARRNAIEGAPLAFLHTTSVSHARGVTPALHIVPRACERVVQSPCVLVSRVGAPTPDKVVAYDGSPAVLSDCLYAIECGTLETAQRLRDVIISDWEGFRLLYGGSCAPFLRADDLVSALAGYETLVAAEPWATREDAAVLLAG